MTANLMAIPFKKRDPGDNDNYCRKKNGHLIIEVKNEGPDKAEAVRVKVDFRRYGTSENPLNRRPQERTLPTIEVHKSGIFEFDCPSDACFAPRCVFDIFIDPGGGPQDRKEKYYRGVCQKGPDLVPVPDGDFLTSGYYWKQGVTEKEKKGKKEEVIIMLVNVQNQGTEVSLESRLRVDFRNHGSKYENIPPLNPSQNAVVGVEIPSPIQKKDFWATVTVDVDDVVKETNETNNVVRDQQCKA